ncbi:hypothetical protein G7046_g1955 [Stylonectria norvegica]|nr:hypothetical protein G7046_g1955 [Stylonectria norvegica]
MARKSLCILCFGDSLTSGYYAWGSGSQPYSLQLKDRLMGAFPNVDIDVVTSGVPGDIATGESFAKRITNECEKGAFDWVIVLAGTNDLALCRTPSSIYTALQNTWTTGLSTGSKVLALTVPETKTRVDWLVERRDELNLSILTHRQANYFVFDLASMIPYHALSEQDREKYWDDGVHLTDDGYDWMGNHIANHLIGILVAEGSYTSPQSKTRKPSAKQARETVSFEEETGNPRNINEGYVVVRKEDLE